MGTIRPPCKPHNVPCPDRTVECKRTCQKWKEYEAAKATMQDVKFKEKELEYYQWDSSRRRKRAHPESSVKRIHKGG